MEHLAVCLLTQYRFSVVDCEFTLQVCHLAVLMSSVSNSLCCRMLTMKNCGNDGQMVICS